ncbi:restriction endonuclease subunit S [Bacillus toyonensis]|uniref:restriction endonuclease subunit S n=1 Tax=Bacillus toyonensis TaxID=155322 RepID=UPI001038AF04|nr:restriction endonuclease subunit S [Bacillus toyonensis]TBX66042.1 restriction endonuclease subunit S [Bacillus toyonensis]
MSKKYLSKDYKNTGIIWIGKIPKDWSIFKIKYTTYVKGRIGWQGLKSDEFIDEGPYLVTGTDFDNGYINWETCYHISEKRYNEAPSIQLKENDLLITKDGTIGKVAIVKKVPNKAILNSGIFVTRSNQYEVEYMYWLLNSVVFDKYIKFNETGSTIKHLYQETFESFSYPLPDRNEQKKIVIYLNEEIGKVDRLIKDKEKLINLLEEKRQAMITEAVTKGLNPNVKMKDSGVEWIGEIPEHWECLSFRRLTFLQQGLQIAQDERFYESGGNRLEYITVKSINSSDVIKEYIENASDRVICTEEDVLLARTGATGLVVTNIKGVFHNNFFKVNYDTQKIMKDFLVFYLKQESIQSHFKLVAGTTTIPDLNHGEFLSTKCLVPPLIEQKVITDYLEAKEREHLGIVEDIKLQIKKLKDYRQSLIYEAVTGKIDVRDFEIEA